MGDEAGRSVEETVTNFIKEGGCDPGLKDQHIGPKEIVSSIKDFSLSIADRTKIPHEKVVALAKSIQVRLEQENRPF